MKRIVSLFVMLFCFTNMVTGQGLIEPWQPSELMNTSTLVDRITKNNKNTVIISIGPDALIKNSYNAGPSNNAENITKLKNYLKGIEKDKEVVIYCGCCPFDKCPNIRPAFKVLKEAGFKNPKLLNIPKNIKTDWIDKGYPVM